MMMMVMGVPPNKVLTMQTKAAHGYGLALGSTLSLLFLLAARRLVGYGQTVESLFPGR